MKTLTAILLLFSCRIFFGQEFKVYENGLIYSPYAMEKLAEVVGDKNEEFRVCELPKRYMSVPQTKGQIFTLKNISRDSLVKDLKANLPIEAFIVNYTDSATYSLRLLTKSTYKNWKGDTMVGIWEHGERKSLKVLDSLWESSNSNCWVWDVSGDNYVEVAYLDNPFTSQQIPEKYARKLMYSECLIDTTSQIYPKDAKEARWMPKSDSTYVKQAKFLGYVSQEFVKPRPEYSAPSEMTVEEFKAMMLKIEQWEEDKKSFVKEELSKRQEFCKLLDEAFVEALINKNSDNEFETYVSDFLSPSQALVLKRNRRVVGQCSMDDRPRVHAMNIAQLAGESLNWDIFLRAHLNVLNDQVDRVSDGSWAWEDRQTYIKELEELNIETMDLIFGIGLRARNVSEGYYYGSVGRLGRAVSESQNAVAFEKELLTAIQDVGLDDFNRMQMFYLYDNMKYYQDRSEDKEQHNRARNEAMAYLPKYFFPTEE